MEQSSSPSGRNISKRPNSNILFLPSSSAGISQNRAGLLVAGKVEGFQQSCERVRLEGHEAIPWSGLLDDFSALSTSLRLMRDSVPANFNTLAVIPHDVPPDIHAIHSIPNILSTCPGDKPSEDIDQLVSHIKSEQLLCSGRLFSQQDAKQLRLKVQTFNRHLDDLKGLLQQTVAESRELLLKASHSSNTVQPTVPKPAQLRKDYESLYHILTRLYRGTSLCPPPL